MYAKQRNILEDPNGKKPHNGYTWILVLNLIDSYSSTINNQIVGLKFWKNWESKVVVCVGNFLYDSFQVLTFNASIFSILIKLFKLDYVSISLFSHNIGESFTKISY